MCFFYLIEQHSKCLLHTLQVLYICNLCDSTGLLNTGLFKMIVGVLTTCHTQYTWDRSICIFLFNGQTLKVCVTYLTGALYVHPLWFYKHQHDNLVRSKLFVACQRWRFQWRFWFVPSVPGYLQEEEEHRYYPWRNPIEKNHMGLHLEKEDVKTPTIISNNPVLHSHVLLTTIRTDHFPKAINFTPRRATSLW